jgi:hypothetical protein
MTYSSFPAVRGFSGSRPTAAQAGGGWVKMIPFFRPEEGDRQKSQPYLSGMLLLELAQHPSGRIALERIRCRVSSGQSLHLSG